MRAHRAGVVAISAFGAVMATSVLASQPGVLPPSEIRAKFFNGQPFIAATTSNVKFKMTFMADGKMKREPVGPGNKGTGTWKLSKEGFCTAWSGGKSSCFTVASAGDNKWSVLKGSTILATWSK